MKFFIKDYLAFSKTERNGIIILIIILLLLLIVPYFLPYIISNEKVDFAPFKNEIEKFNQSVISQDSIGHEAIAGNFIPEKTEMYKENLFFFDPNYATADEWRRFGVREKTIYTIQNYISKGGKFYKKEDLKKVYGFSQKDYLRLENYIAIPEKNKFKLLNPKAETNFKSKFKNLKNDDENLQIEINTADSIEWMKLKGIGEKLSSRVIKYRNALGGFTDIKQVEEVWGIDSVLFQQIEPHLTVENTAIKKININSSGLEELKKHPYLSVPIASQIVNFRQQHGNYRSLEDLKKLYLMNEKLFEKIKPYLSVE